MPSKAVSDYLASIGAKGGAAGRGESKRRGSRAHYSEMRRAGWAAMSAEERSAEMSRRRHKGMRAEAAIHYDYGEAPFCGARPRKPLLTPLGSQQATCARCIDLFGRQQTF